LDYFRPDCESPAQSDTFRKRRTICNLTPTLRYVKCLAKFFRGTFHNPVQVCAKAYLRAQQELDKSIYLRQLVVLGNIFGRGPGAKTRLRGTRLLRNWLLRPGPPHSPRPANEFHDPQHRLAAHLFERKIRQVGF
jgi:hypothetical protein